MEALCSRCEQGLPRPQIVCYRCSLPFSEDSVSDKSQSEPICGECQRFNPHYDRVITAYQYCEPIPYLIQQFKTHKHFQFGTHMSHALATKVIESYKDTALPELITPVPLHWQKLLSRGFNQSAFIAEKLQNYFDIKLQNTMKKARVTETQKYLSRKERLRNLKHAYTCIDDIQGKHVAVIDDVVTTGATIEAISKTLKQHGAVRVDVWCLARTPKIRRVLPQWDAIQ